MRLPGLPNIDTFSFWLGFAAAAVLAFLLFYFRRQLGDARQAVSTSLRGVRERLTSGAENNLREDVLRFAQTAHLAGSLFALDDILLPPRLLVPDPGFDPTAPLPDETLTSVIPVIPDWPEIAALYQAPVLSVAEGLGGGGDLLVLGGPGAGKTTLLAHLASRAAQQDTALFPESVTPIFVHAADLPLPRPPEADVAQPLVSAAQARASALTAARLPRHLRVRLAEFKCVIFLDGLDELPPNHIADVAAWLGEFRKQYGSHRLIAAAGTAGYGPLLHLGLGPIFIAPWGADDYRALIHKWREAWESVIRARKKRPAPADVDPHVIAGWLASGNLGRTVFEVTLKVWAAFGGDARGKRPADWLEAYILRHGVKPLGQKALGKIATALLTRENESGLSRAEVTALVDAVFTGSDSKPQLDTDDYLDDLVDRRLLVKHAQDRLSFQHSLAAAYCAATALAADPESALPGNSPAWARALYFFAALGDLTSMAAIHLNQPADLLHSDLMACALWLRDAPATARWRGEVFRRLSRLLMDANQPESLRLRALAGFVAAHDPAVGALFKQALTHADPLTRRMATLGAGTLGEASAIPPVAAQLADFERSVRWAAALGLAALGTQPAIEALAQGLLGGDDDLRRGCAEALARLVEEGHPLLQEAIAHDDLAVRRAAVYGLAATKADWAYQQLDDVQRNESQWLVRSAAQEVMAQRKEPQDRTTKPYQAPESLGWLIAWAAQQGTGVPPGRAAIDVLNRALREGDESTRRAAAEALGRLADPSAARELYAALRDPAPWLREAAFRGLAHIAAASGQRLAAPVG